MQTTTSTKKLLFYRFKTAENTLGWLIVATGIIEALRLFKQAYPKEKSYVVSVHNKNNDKRINLN